MGLFLNEISVTAMKQKGRCNYRTRELGVPECDFDHTSSSVIEYGPCNTVPFLRSQKVQDHILHVIDLTLAMNESQGVSSECWLSQQKLRFNFDFQFHKPRLDR